MRRGILIALLVHMYVLFFVWLNVPGLFRVTPEVKVIKVSIVSAKDVKKTTEKKEIKKVNTQQSAAPKKPPKEKPKPKPQPKKKSEKPQLVQSQDKVKTEKKVKVPEVKKDVVKEEKQTPVPAKPVKEDSKETDVAEKTISRPEKLDKSPDKKKLVEDKNAPKKEVTEDDFLSALSFAEDLKGKQSALEEAQEDSDPITINDLEFREDIVTIRKHVERNWYVPPGIQGGQHIEVLVKVNRDGTLQSLKVVKSSGQPFFDKSLERAIRKSSPLPLPQENYEIFREMVLVFNDR